MLAMGISSPILISIWGLAPTTWIVMWSALGLVTVGLILLLRTRWSTDRKWRMCAILSLWVHALIVVFSMTIRIVSGPPGPGDGGPIRVTVLPAEPITAAIDPAEVGEARSMLDELAAPSLVAPEAEPLDLQSGDTAELTPDSLVMEQLTEPASRQESPSPAFLEAPPLMPAPVEAAESLAVADSENAAKPLVEPKQIAELADSVAKAAERIAESIAEVLPPQAATRAQQAKTTAADIPDLYADRFANDLTELATQRGGSSQTEAAVQAALAWLAANQSVNGGWDASKFGAGIEREVLGHNRQGAGAEADTGVTGLAILAFLGSGNSHHYGSYRTEVAKALEFLRQQQRPDGSLFGGAELYARMYCHSMATLAACEAYALTRDERLDAMCRAAVAYSLSMQHPTDGGWRYRRGDMGDTSQLGWVLMALKSAQLAGIQVPDVTWTRAERFLRRVKRGEHGGLASYRPDSPASRTMTAEAWFCHQLLQADRGGTVNPMAIQEAVKSLEQELPSSANRNLYYWYYATLALHQNQQTTPEDTSSWDSWNQALTTALIATQRSDGSWEADTVWGGYGGKVYTTALSALCLEVYYRYSPSHEPRELAGREDWQSIQR
jgi:hypothetical protein